MFDHKPQLPGDAGPHYFSNIEWWYFFTYLSGDQGGQFAVMGSFFRVGETQLNKGSYLIYSLIDLRNKTQKSSSFIDPILQLNMMALYLPGYLLLHPTDLAMLKLYKNLLTGTLPSPHARLNQAQVDENPTHLIYDQFQLTFSGEKQDSFHVQLSDHQSVIDLRFTPAKPIALIGGDGKPGKLYYYSFTRNQVEGQIHTSRGTEHVKGQGWFDHQWGIDYGFARGSGWNWFGLQFDDGREILLNEETLGKGSQTSSTMANLIEKDGTVRFTRGALFEKIGYWKSQQTNANYPVEWRILIPDFSIDLHIRPVLPNQEMPILGPIRAIWEGACILDGFEILPSGSRKTLTGKGFMELVGYAY